MLPHSQAATRLTLKTWRMLVDEREPWSAMPIDDRDGHLRTVFEAAFRYDAHANRAVKLARACLRGVIRQHIRFRVSQGISSSDVRRDLVYMRVAVLEALHLLPDAARSPDVLMETLRIVTATVLADRTPFWEDTAESE